MNRVTKRTWLMGLFIGILLGGLLFFLWEYMTEARSTIAANLDIPSKNIVIAGTHTHSGPSMEIIKEKEPDYLRQLIASVVKAAEAAWADRCDAEFYIARGQTEGVTFAKVNVDENPDVAMGLGIQAIPTLFLFRDGRAVDKVVGVQSKQALKAMIDRNR